MKTTEIRELSAAELDTKLADLKEELFNLVFKWQPVNVKSDENS